MFLYGYKAAFIQGFLKAGKKHLVQKFFFTYRYIDNVLSINNSMVLELINLVYPCELDIIDTTEPNTSALYSDCFLCINKGKFVTKFYDKKDYFNFPIVNFPFF